MSQLGRKVTDCVLVWSKRGHFSGANESLCPMRSFVQVLVLSSDPVWSDAVPYGPMCSDAVRTPVISHSRLRTLVSGNLQGDITRGSVLDSLLPLSHNHTDKQTDTYLLTYLLTYSFTRLSMGRDRLRPVRGLSPGQNTTGQNAPLPPTNANGTKCYKRVED